ncbi:HNH endonuclease signature motif containing protein [Williamsia serinedens]|uniref:Lipid carrier protein YhbT, contains SCP2 domain n=1 Tax=Williamsia serinedens TaxID=391736 RepID=A0ABT1H4F3_9NOCA|nr:HNH endonuclease signature motif containing protein [Williamsia serinedens]MCP2162119.1 putative lipid carrier protein YhbT, contains SCP2 domain [Williamsia serinedens]
MELTGIVDAREALRSVMAVLADLPVAADESETVDRISLMESIKAACAAGQAADTLRLQELRSAAEAEAGVPVERRCRGLSAEVALARRVSGNAGSRHLGFARAMGEMPNTFARLREGSLSEWRATILVRETGYLQVEDRRVVDQALCADPATLDGVGDRALEALAKRIAYARDPQAVVDRNASAPKDRRVTMRPKPDAMVQLSALLPMKAGIAAYAAVKQHADALVGDGDRTHAQVMADTLLERLTGKAAVEDLPVAVDVVITGDALVGFSDAAADVPGYGPIPADTARSLISDALDADALVTLRRLFANPDSGALVAMESRARIFPSGLRRFITRRDVSCRMPYCDAPIAEIDHAHPHNDGGPTDSVNGNGLCRTHNRQKENSGWQVTTAITDDGTHEALIRTPTGHEHLSRAPDSPGHAAA